jgi:hypothetical protein
VIGGFPELLCMTHVINAPLFSRAAACLFVWLSEVDDCVYCGSCHLQHQNSLKRQLKVGGIVGGILHTERSVGEFPHGIHACIQSRGNF